MPSRVLVVEVNWLGDLVMSLPALKAVKNAWPKARLSVLVREELATFFDGVGFVDEVIPRQRGTFLARLLNIRHSLREVRERHFDIAILFPNSFDSALIPALARIPVRAGVSTDGRGLLLTHKAAAQTPDSPDHQTTYWLQMLRDTLGIGNAAGECAIQPAPRHRVTMSAWLEKRRKEKKRLVALAPGAAYGPAKEWPQGYYAALIDLLADRYNTQSVLVGAPGEAALCEQIAAGSSRGALVAAGRTSIGELAALLSMCEGFAGNDSGSMHLAAALGIPTVGIFGSTNPARTGPVGARATVVYHKLDCSPCLDRTCRFGHYNCLTGIVPAEVAAALERVGMLA